MTISRRKAVMVPSGFDAETRDSLEGVRTEVRRGYYGTSSPRMVACAVIIILSLVSSILGLLAGQPLMYPLVLGGIGGLMLAAVWLTYR